MCPFQQSSPLWILNDQHHGDPHKPTRLLSTFHVAPGTRLHKNCYFGMVFVEIVPAAWLIPMYKKNTNIIHLKLVLYLGVSKNKGTPKSSILIGFSFINHPFWATPILGNTHLNSTEAIALGSVLVQDSFHETNMFHTSVAPTCFSHTVGGSIHVQHTVMA